jgi:hypothetical protein
MPGGDGREPEPQAEAERLPLSTTMRSNMMRSSGFEDLELHDAI